MSRKLFWGDFSDSHAVKGYRDSDTGEYVIRLYEKHAGGKQKLLPDSDYFGTEKAEAISTGRAMLKHASQYKKNPAPEGCPLCGKAAGAPYRVYDAHGKVVNGCVGEFHSGHLVQTSESNRWHNRPEAKRIRAALERGRLGKGFGELKKNPKSGWHVSNKAVRKHAHANVKKAFSGKMGGFAIEVKRGVKWIELARFVAKPQAVDYGKSLVAKFKKQTFRVTW